MTTEATDTSDAGFQRELLHAIRGAADLPADKALAVRAEVNRMLALVLAVGVMSCRDYWDEP